MMLHVYCFVKYQRGKTAEVSKNPEEAAGLEGGQIVNKKLLFESRRMFDMVGRLGGSIRGVVGKQMRFGGRL